MTQQLAVIDGQWEELKPLVIEQAIDDLLERFLASLDVRDNSKATYSRQLREFVSWLKETGRAGRLSELMREDILAYRSHLQQEAGESGRGLSAYSVGGYLTAVRRLYAWLEAERIYPDITRGIKGPKLPKSRAKDTLSPEQLRECLEAIWNDQELSRPDILRNYAIFNLMARTALRDIEVSRATVGDIRIEQGKNLLYVHGKGRDSADEFVILTKEAYEPIQAYLKERGHITDGSPLFCSSSRRNYGKRLSPRSVSRIIKNTLRTADLDDRRLSAHSLRHTAITLAILGGAALSQAQAMARHASPVTTQRYFNDLERVSNGAELYVSF